MPKRKVDANGTPIKRRPNFSSAELETLLQAVQNRHAALFSKVRIGYRPTNKNAAWEEVTGEVSAVSGEGRTAHEVRRKWADVKSEAKKRINKYKRDMLTPGAEAAGLWLSEVDRRVKVIMDIADVEVIGPPYVPGEGVPAPPVVRGGVRVMVVPGPAVVPAVGVPAPTPVPVMVVPAPAVVPVEGVPAPVVGSPAPAVVPVVGVPAPAVVPVVGVPAPAVVPVMGVPAPAAVPVVGVPAPAAVPVMVVPAPAVVPSPAAVPVVGVSAPVAEEIETGPGHLFLSPVISPLLAAKIEWTDETDWVAEPSTSAAPAFTCGASSALAPAPSASGDVVQTMLDSQERVAHSLERVASSLERFATSQESVANSLERFAASQERTAVVLEALAASLSEIKRTNNNKL